MIIDKKAIKQIFPELTPPDFNCINIGLISHDYMKSILTFVESENFINNLVLNQNIKAVFCSEKVVSKIPSKYSKIVCDDPKYYFFTLHNNLNKKHYKKTKNRIDNSADIHPSANISSNNVLIGKNVKIGENVTIKPDVEIGENCIISSGSVIGQEGFEFKRTSKGVISVFHNKKTKLFNNVYVGANSIIDKGIYRDTTVGENCKIDSNCHITHASMLEENVIVASSSIIGGSANIKKGVWVGPGSIVSNNITIGSKARIGIGSNVIKNIPENSTAFGNPSRVIKSGSN